MSPTACDHASVVTHSLAFIELLLRDWNFLHDSSAQGLLVITLNVTRLVLCRNGGVFQAWTCPDEKCLKTNERPKGYTFQDKDTL